MLDRLVGPFVSGVYAGDPERLSLRSAFPQVHEAEKAAGSVIRGMMHASKDGAEPRKRPTLMSFREGNETLVRGLAAKIGAGLRVNAEVTRIAMARAGAAGRFEVRVQGTGGEQTLLAERVVLATSTDVAGRMSSEVNAELGRLLRGIEHVPVAVTSLGYRRDGVEFVAVLGTSAGGIGIADQLCWRGHRSGVGDPFKRSARVVSSQRDSERARCQGGANIFICAHLSEGVATVQFGTRTAIDGDGEIARGDRPFIFRGKLLPRAGDWKLLGSGARGCSGDSSALLSFPYS